MANLTPIAHSVSTSSLSHYDIVNNAEQDLKISDVPLSDFVKSSVKICALYGLNVPELPLMQELYDFIKGHFHWASIKHFELAFKLNASHQLDKKTEHFGAFTIAFIGDVLTAYRPIRDRIYLEANKPQLLPENTAQNEEKADLKSLIESHLDLIRKGKEEYIITGRWIIEALEQEEMINVNTFSEAEYKQAKEKARKILMSNRQLTQSRIERMTEDKRNEFRQALVNERLRQLYIIYLKNHGV